MNFLGLAGLLFPAIGLESLVGHSILLCAIVRFSVLLELRGGKHYVSLSERRGPFSNQF